MKLTFALLMFLAVFLIPSISFAVDFDGSGSTASSTLDAPEAAEGTEPDQGTWHVEANS